jgi:hypothetical protein
VEHTYYRPGWVCITDGEPWPCAAKRGEYRARLDREGIAAAARIRTVLGAHALDAQRDLHLSDESAYERFVAWSYANSDEVAAAPDPAQR